jgi:Zn-finger nucleic acid-binding protein
MNCPGCDLPDMRQETFAGNYGSTLQIDVCHHCNGIWFDGRESLQLAPGSTLQLFKSMHERHASARAPLLEAKACPRCKEALSETTDLVRNTRFSYFRCATHGRFITFFQWLREKSLVRAPNPKELDELKARVKVVNCSNCGAPISLEKEKACNHCAAPVSILATENIEKALQNLSTKELDRNTFKPERLAEAMMIKQRMEDQYRQEHMVDSLTGISRGGSRYSFGADLVLGGIGLLFEVIAS